MNKWECVGWVNFYNKDKQASIKTFEQSGKTKMTFTLKLDKGKSFIDCETWSKTIIENLQNGDYVELTNYRIVKNSWQDATTGVKKYVQIVVVDEVVRLGQGDSNNGSFIDKSNEIFDANIKNDLDQEIKEMENAWNEKKQELLKQELEQQQIDSVDLDWLNELNE